MGRRVTVALVLFALAGCGDSSSEGFPPSGSSREEAAAPSPAAPTRTTRVEVVPPASAGTEFDARAIYEREAPGVVTVISLFGGDGDEEAAAGEGEGVGSGFVISGRGEIVTNAHVVTSGEGPHARPAQEVYVEFADSNKVRAEVVGHDLDADVALLRVQTAGLTLRPLPLGRSDRTRVGEPVAAIGSPFGERQSLSVGVVSAVDRSIRSLTAFEIPGAIQTDAAVNPGNSGGPLVNARGQVIGINQQIKSRSGGGEGVGFAVPVDLVKRSIQDLRDDGDVDYAYLGVASVELYPQLAERFGLPVREGVWLQSLSSGGPAAGAGLRGGAGTTTSFQGQEYRAGGDVVTRLGGHPVRDADDLALAVMRHQPGDRVPVELWRDGSRRRVEVQLEARPSSAAELP
jgi:S1-C subfamily serine protease